MVDEKMRLVAKYVESRHCWTAFLLQAPKWCAACFDCDKKGGVRSRECKRARGETSAPKMSLSWVHECHSNERDSTPEHSRECSLDRIPLFWVPSHFTGVLTWFEVDTNARPASSSRVICVWSIFTVSFSLLPTDRLACLLQSDQNSKDPLSCISFSAKEPLNIGHFCGKWPIKIRDPMSLRHPVQSPRESRKFCVWSIFIDLTQVSRQHASYSPVAKSMKIDHTQKNSTYNKNRPHTN